MFSVFDSSGTAFFLELAIKSSLVLGLGALLSYCFAKAEARVRYSVWAASLTGALLLTLLSGLVPSLRIPILPHLGASIPAATEKVATPMVIPEGTPIRATAQLPVLSTSSEALKEKVSPIHAVIVGAWLLGILVVLGRIAVGLVAISQTLRKSTPLNGSEWRRLVTHSQKKIALRGRIRLFKNSKVPTPMTWGLFRPVVLMPVQAKTWPEEQRRIVLLHELIHVKRRDWLFLVLGQLSCAVYWFHPLAWYAAKRMSLEREHSCDEDVIALGAKPSVYAKHLLDVARLLSSRSVLPFSTLSMTSTSKLEIRIRSILRRRKRRRRRESLLSTISVLATAIVLLVFIHPFAEPPSIQADEREVPTEMEMESGASTESSGVMTTEEGSGPVEVNRPGADKESNSPSTTEGEGMPSSTEPPSSSEEPGSPDESSSPPAGGMGSGDEEEEEDPEQASIDAAMNRARRAFEEERYGEAEMILRDVLRRDLRNGRAWYFLAYSVALQEGFDQAILLYEKAATFEDVRPIALYRLACIHARRGDTRKALEALEQAVRSGFWEVDVLRTAEELDTLRNHEVFQGILKLAESQAEKR